MSYAFVPLHDRLARIKQYSETVEILEKIDGKWRWVKVEEEEDSPSESGPDRKLIV